MKVHLINPSSVSFGTAVITPRWQYVLAAATPASSAIRILVDETLSPLDPDSIHAGDAVGIGIHTANALRGYEIGKLARERGRIRDLRRNSRHTLPGRGDRTGWRSLGSERRRRCRMETSSSRLREGHATPVVRRRPNRGERVLPARWDLIPRNRYMWASVQTVRGCPKHCSFCSVWKTDGQRPRQRTADVVIEEIVQLRRLGFRFIALADDNFYPVTLTDLDLATKQKNEARLSELNALRAERFELMARLAQLPDDMVFFTQITMEAAEDTSFLDAMKAARIKGALVGVEAVTPAGLKDVYKDFNLSGDVLIERLKTFRRHGVHVLGSFIFGLPSDRPETFDATAAAAINAELTFAQFVTLSPYPGTVDFARWEKQLGDDPPKIAGVPLTRRWLIPQALRPKLYWDHPVMSAEEIRSRTQGVWDAFYSWGPIWRRSSFIKSSKGRLAFVLISRIYRQMYADTGIATDSARVTWSGRWTRIMAKPCRRLFAGKPMPDLKTPEHAGEFVRLGGWANASKVSTKDLGVC